MTYNILKMKNLQYLSVFFILKKWSQTSFLDTISRSFAPANFHHGRYG
jgi:hypothetical protein